MSEFRLFRSRISGGYCLSDTPVFFRCVPALTVLLESGPSAQSVLMITLNPVSFFLLTTIPFGVTGRGAGACSSCLWVKV